MKSLLLILVLAASAFPGCRSTGPNAATQPAPAADPGRFTGTLHGGMMAIGGETTGWVLKRQGQADLEVDVSRVFSQARALDGKSVVIDGKIQEKRYAETCRC